MTDQTLTQIPPSRQDYAAVDDAFEDAAFKIMHAFKGQEMMVYLDRLEKAMNPLMPVDQLKSIMVLLAEIEAAND